MQPDLAAWAVRYARHGWPVFPLRAGQKTPATKHGCKDATTDIDHIARWWRTHPDHNIGLATGVTVDVLDLDGETGATTFDEWAEAHHATPDIDGTPIVETPGGGIHIYGAPTGAGNRAGMLPSVDWRGHGGYVVAPPSRHPNGGLYRFADPEIERCRLVVWPAALRQLITPPRQARGHTARLDWAGDGHGTPYGVAAIRQISEQLASTGEGARNHALYVAARRSLELAAGGQIVEHAAIQYIVSAAQHCGLDDTEIDRTIKSARRSDITPCRPA